MSTPEMEQLLQTAITHVNAGELDQGEGAVLYRRASQHGPKLLLRVDIFDYQVKVSHGDAGAIWRGKLGKGR